VREAQMAKIPYMLVVGDKEEAASTVAPRSRTGGMGEEISAEAFIEQLKREIAGPAGGA
jgi:threonyl-tRNA synthetase